MASIRWPAILALFFALAAFAGVSTARDEPQRPAAAVALSELPREARDVVGLIRRGGPFR